MALLKHALERFPGVLLEPGPKGSSEVSLEELGTRHADRPIQLFVASGKPPPEAVADLSPQPGRWGWVELDLPTEKERTLFLGGIGVKAEWFDRETGLAQKNAAAITLFNRLEKDMLGGFKKGLRARNIKSGARNVPKGLRFSSAAEAWLEQGGLLRQEGVNNIEYPID